MSDATLSRAADVSLKGHPGPQDEPSVICCLLPYRLIVQKRGGDYVVEPNQFITFRSIALLHVHNNSRTFLSFLDMIFTFIEIEQ